MDNTQTQDAAQISLPETRTVEGHVLHKLNLEEWSKASGLLAGLPATMPDILALALHKEKDEFADMEPIVAVRCLREVIEQNRFLETTEELQMMAAKAEKVVKRKK